MIRWAGHVASMRQTRNTYRILVGKPKRKRTLQRARHIHGWSEKFSVSTIDGNIIGKFFPPKLVYLS
jgi:hypothetical protein